MYSIEGNIGVGKSTVMKYLSEKYPCFLEPVEEWTLLDHFYADVKTYAFPFQFQVLLSQFNQLKEINKIENQPCFMERSPWASKNVFIEMLKLSQLWNNNDEKSYNKFYKNINLNIKKIFYLDLAPEKCLERIKKRNRYEERNISIEYLQKLENQYKEAFLLKCPYKIIYINVADKTPEEVYNEILNFIT